MPTYPTPGQLRFGMPSEGTIGAVAPAIGSVVGSIIDANTQNHANQATAASAREQMDFQAQQSSTQYQRAVKDMEAAGLNPALAYQQGGDSAAGGASYESRPTTSNSANTINNAIQAFTQLANGSAQRQLIRAQTDKTAADTQQTQTTTKFDTKSLEDRLALMTATRNRGEQDYQHETEAYDFYHKALPTNLSQLTATLKNTNQLTDTSAAAAKASRAQSTLMEQQFQNEWFRKNVAPYLNSTAQTIKAFTPAMSFIP